MYGEEAVRRLAEIALGASKADQTEVLFWGTDRQLTRFASNTIHQNVAEQGAEVSVRVAVGKRQGVAAANQLDEASLRDAVERATAIARLQPENPDAVPLPGPTPWERPRAFHASTAEATPGRRADGVAEVVERARRRDLLAFGAFSTETLELAVASSSGIWTYCPRTTAELNAVVMTGIGADAGSGFASHVAGDVDDVDAIAVAEAAVERCARNHDPADLPPGDYEVLLEPAAVAEIVQFLGSDGFNGLAVQEGRSFLSGKLGQELAGRNVSLWDDGHDRRGLPLPFDFEGVAKRRVVLFDRGVAREVVHDTATAARAGTLSTGHALPAPNTYGPVPLNLIMASGEAPDRESMLRGIGRGVWVTRFWYTNLLDAPSLTITGMTRDGTFLVENGQVVGALKNLRFTQSLVAALGDVRALSRDVSLERAWLGCALVPALHLGRFSFTGVSS
jgi:predicted Zn-dependent protease